MINYQKSNPNNPNESGKQLKAGYMLVEDFEYVPYSKKSYDKIYIDDTKEKDAEGNKIYGEYNIYKSKPNALTLLEVLYIYNKIYTQNELLESLSDDLLPEARGFLEEYIMNHTGRNMYSCKKILKDSQTARDAWALATYNLMLASEGYLSEGESIIIAETPNNQNLGIKFSMKDGANYHWAINESEVRTIAKISYDGNKYMMEVKFYIFDYYDWNKWVFFPTGLVSPREMFRLCQCGAARFYENWGLYETQLTWVATEEGRQQALNAVKNGLAGE